MTIAEFISYCASRRGDFLGSIAGVQPLYVQDIASITRFELPALYKAFLEKMGEHQGGFEVKGYSFDAIDLYDVLASSPESYPRDRFALMALHRPPPGLTAMNLYFDRQAPIAVPGDYAVVAFEDPEEAGEGPGYIAPKFDSFWELLTVWAFRSFSLTQGRPQANLLIPASHYRDCLSLLGEKMGFQSALAPTTHCWVGSKQGLDVRVYRRPQAPKRQQIAEPTFDLDLAGNDAREVARIREVLCDNIPVLETRST